MSDIDAASGEDELTRLDQLLAEALRLSLSARPDNFPERKSMRSVLAEACTIARTQALYPEQVIVMLKSAWMRLGDAGYVVQQDAQPALNRAVAVCIQEYFAEAPGVASGLAPRLGPRLERRGPTAD